MHARTIDRSKGSGGRMRSSPRQVRAVNAAFDDPNLIADAGLIPAVALAEQTGLPDVVADQMAMSMRLSQPDVEVIPPERPAAHQQWIDPIHAVRA
jgi:hypothetical protein